jgi:hypothetical protein
MRVMSLLKIVSLAAAVALLASFSGASMAAKMTKVPPGACAFEKKFVANGAMCSYDCDPGTMWCSQQMCTNGQFQKIISCYGAFCTNKCGG